MAEDTYTHYEFDEEDMWSVTYASSPEDFQSDSFFIEIIDTECFPKLLIDVIPAQAFHELLRQMQEAWMLRKVDFTTWLRKVSRGALNAFRNNDIEWLRECWEAGISPAHAVQFLKSSRKASKADDDSPTVSG